jgi:hypothetical protein
VGDYSLLALRKSDGFVPASMLPPDFVKQLEAKGTHPPHCWECASVASLEGLDLVCMKYGAYILLYSSCSSHERRGASDSPILSKAEVARKFRWGLNELRK